MRGTRVKQKSIFVAHAFLECRRPFSVQATSTRTTLSNSRKHWSRKLKKSVQAALPCRTDSPRRQSPAWNLTCLEDNRSAAFRLPHRDFVRGSEETIGSGYYVRID